MSSRNLKIVLPYFISVIVMILTIMPCDAEFKFVISPGDPNRYSPSDDEDFVGLDRNGDGAISQSEWLESPAEFYRLDFNHDGFLTQSEYWGRNRGAFPRANPPRDAFSAMDLDRNGLITQDEWTANPNDFFRLDRNRDGALSRSEFLGQGGFYGDDFSGPDQYGEGTILRRQWRGGPADFYRLDTNHDGVLSPEETGDGPDNQSGGTGQALQTILEGLLNRKQ